MGNWPVGGDCGRDQPGEGRVVGQPALPMIGVGGGVADRGWIWLGGGRGCGLIGVARAPRGRGWLGVRERLWADWGGEGPSGAGLAGGRRCRRLASWPRPQSGKRTDHSGHHSNWLFRSLLHSGRWLLYV